LIQIVASYNLTGAEVAGEVTDVGINVKTLKKGDKVVTLLGYLVSILMPY
jgi:D-arabinose 1-dehydrogenase-like Zn-dependent alcohol dehydrogenase